MQQTQPVIRLAIDLDGVLTEHPALLARAANDKFNLVLRILRSLILLAMR